MTYRTLGDLRQELQARLGFASTGAAAGVNLVTINSFLTSAQTWLYWNVDWKVLRVRIDKTLGIGETLLDYPVEINPERVSQIYTNINPTGTPSWVPVKQGITPEWYNTVSQQNYPQRYEFYQQIEFWPQPNVDYQLRFWGTAPLARFTQDNDPCSLDDGLVFLHALANGKAHYKQPDAQNYANQLAVTLSQVRGTALRGVYNKSDAKSPPEPKPVVV